MANNWGQQITENNWGQSKVKCDKLYELTYIVSRE